VKKVAEFGKIMSVFHPALGAKNEEKLAKIQ
jgi:hypothetical protein